MSGDGSAPGGSKPADCGDPSVTARADPPKAGGAPSEDSAGARASEAGSCFGPVVVIGWPSGGPSRTVDGGGGGSVAAELATYRSLRAASTSANEVQLGKRSAGSFA